MERLRIAMFSDSALPILNGVSISVDALISELRNQGHSVHLYAPRNRNHRDSDPNTYRFRSVGTPWAPQYPIAYPPFYRKLLQFRKHTYDVIHTHTPFALGMVGLRWAESDDIPIVSTYHTLYDRYAHYLTPIPRRYSRFRIAKHTNFYYNRVNQVITPSEASLKWLQRHSVNREVSVIPTGSPGRSFLERSSVRMELGIPAEAKILLYVGRLAREKNLPVLIESAAQAMQFDPNLRLWLVGDGPFRQECTSLVRKLNIGDRVRFVGFVPRSEVDRYYAASDLFVFSSITETQGLVVQEAMTYGLPAVAVDGGGASENIENGRNGFVVKNDCAEFASTIVNVLGDDSLWTRLSEGAAKSVRTHGISEMTEQVLKVYKKAIHGERLEVAPEQFSWI